jgi:hypothetical protein
MGEVYRLDPKGQRDGTTPLPTAVAVYPVWARAGRHLQGVRLDAARPGRPMHRHQRHPDREDECRRRARRRGQRRATHRLVSPARGPTGTGDVEPEPGHTPRRRPVPPQLSKTGRSEAVAPANPRGSTVTHPERYVQAALRRAVRHCRRRRWRRWRGREGR